MSWVVILYISPCVPLWVCQYGSPRGIFINQSKYALESIKKYGMETCELADTPMVEKSKLDEDPQGKAVDPTRYRGMISTLMYLTARTINMGLWYPKDSCIALTAFADADHAVAKILEKRNMFSKRNMFQSFQAKHVYIFPSETCIYSHLQRKKTTDDSQETVDVSEESEPEPESVRGVEPSSKSISQTEAKEAEASRQVHATYARIVIESVPKPTRRRKLGKVTCDPPKKLKGVPSLTLEEQEAADIMQALKESKRQLGIEGSSKETGTIPGVPDESIVISATSSEGTGTKPGVPDKEKEITEENDEDEEMINVEVDDSNKGDEEVTDAAKAVAEKTLEVKDDPKKTELPPTRSSLSVSSVFCDQFLKLSYDSSLVSTVKDTTDTKINSLLEVKIQSEVPHSQSPSVLSVPVSVIYEPTVPTPVQEYPSIATTTTLPPLSVSTTPSVTQQMTTPISTPTITTNVPIITTVVSESDALFVVQLRVATLEKDVSDLKKIDLSAEALAALKRQVPSVVDNYLGSKVRDVFQKELKKHIADLI
ncbi:hypothetical protein Tco_1410349 [Tanacetum coccineum]